MGFHSKLLNNAVEQMATLPGVGKRTALRLVLDMLDRSESDVQAFTMAMTRLKNDIKFCEKCKNISDNDLCYKGLYHILGGIISPMDGIGPDDLHIDSLIERASSPESKEIILALSATMEGDTTNFYLFRKLKECNVNVSVISRGIGIGNELEYTDEVTLGRSILNRSPFENSLAR